MTRLWNAIKKELKKKTRKNVLENVIEFFEVEECGPIIKVYLFVSILLVHPVPGTCLSRKMTKIVYSMQT